MAVLACGVSDGDDRLVSAGEPLAGLQLRCGGEIPGTIAIPALLELARKSRRYALKLARKIVAQDHSESITAWVEVEPRIDGSPGCDIVVRQWQAGASPPPGEIATGQIRGEIDRQLAELTARLDAGQRVMAVEVEAADLAELGKAMDEGFGRPWTDFVTIAGSNHRQPIHWRLLDGAKVSVAGSQRSWQACLFPQQVPGSDPTGFELCLVAQEPPELPRLAPAMAEAPAEPTPRRAHVGREIAPVLRQPIARIIANAETIRTRLAGPLAEEYSNYAADIASAGQHLLALLDDLSDLEVVESEGFSTAPDRIDLADVARRAAGILGVRARECGIVVDSPREGERLPAIAEFRRVLQVLLNLVGNAIRYSPPNSQVWIRLEDLGARARVIVADQGPGLAQDEQARGLAAWLLSFW